MPTERTSSSAAGWSARRWPPRSMRTAFPRLWSIPPTGRRSSPPGTTAAPRRSPARRCACSRRSASSPRWRARAARSPGIRVSDGLDPGKLDFAPGEGEGALGHMFENRILRAALLRSGRSPRRWRRRADADPRAARGARREFGVSALLDDGTTVHAQLLVGAEGRNSARLAKPPGSTPRAGATTMPRWSLPLGHARSHENIAFEIFYPTGPFAILPLPDDENGHRSAVVWTVHAATRPPGMMKISERGLSGRGGEDAWAGSWASSVRSPRASSHPLGFHHAALDHRRPARAGRRCGAWHPSDRRAGR